MEQEAILSFLEQMAAFVQSVMDDEALSLEAAKLDAHATADGLPAGASRLELLTQRA